MFQIIIKSAVALLTKIFMSVASYEVMEWAFLYFAEMLVKSTKTPHDDVFFEKAKKAYEESNNK